MNGAAIAIIVSLAVLAAGLGITVAALGIRLAGLKGEVGAAKLEVLAKQVAAEDWKKASERAIAELRAEQDRYEALEQRRKAELDELHAIAARCVDGDEILRQLQALSTPGAA